MHTARLMEGTSLARRIVEDTARRAAAVSRRAGTPPCLATVLVGEDRLPLPSVTFNGSGRPVRPR